MQVKRAAYPDARTPSPKVLTWVGKGKNESVAATNSFQRQAGLGVRLVAGVGNGRKD